MSPKKTFPALIRCLLIGLACQTLPNGRAEGATLTVGQGSGFQFSSLTSALATAFSGDTITMASGTYESSTGEIFPISIPVPCTVRSTTQEAVPILRGNGSSTLLILDGVENVRIEGLTFTNGSDDLGGGLRVRHASPEVISCSFVGNSARLGGGLYLENTSAKIEDCTFTLNSAIGEDFSVGGGGAYCILGAPTFLRCLFRKNTGDRLSSGGGLLMDTAGSAIGCRFLGNTGAAFGGGIWFSQPGLARNCIFVQNTTLFWGGGAYIFYAGATVEDCEFYGNRANGIGDGGGGLVSDGIGDQTIRRCTFVGNTSTRAGAVICNRGSQGVFTNCLLAGNFGAQGGGIVCTEPETSPTFTHCTLFQNYTYFRGGGLIGVNSAFATLSSCLFANNYAFDITETNATTDVAATDCLFFGNSVGVYFDEGATEYEHVAEAQAAVPEFQNNLEADPLFPAALSGEWTLEPVYSETDFQTVLRNDCANWAENQFVNRGIVLNPNVSQRFLFAVASNTEKEIRVWGNAADPISRVGDTYVFYDLRPQPGSPAQDAGAPWGPSDDLIGGQRPVDVPGVGRDGSGDEWDIGSFEFQNGPAPTPWTSGPGCVPTATVTPTPSESPSPSATHTPAVGCDLDVSPPGGDGAVNAHDLLEFLRTGADLATLAQFAQCWQASSGAP